MGEVDPIACLCGKIHPILFHHEDRAGHDFSMKCLHHQWCKNDLHIIYNPVFMPKVWELQCNIKGKQGKTWIRILVIPWVQPLLSLAKATALSDLSAGSPRIPAEVCYCSFFVSFHCGWQPSVSLGFIIWLCRPTDKTTHSANTNTPTPLDHLGLPNLCEWAFASLSKKCECVTYEQFSVIV